MTDKPRLSHFIGHADHAQDYSQFHEQSAIAHVLSVLGEGSRVCVEFGSGDGLECSNTAQLWRHEGWRAVLIEPDAARFGVLTDNTAGYDNVTCIRAKVTPTGPDSLEELLYGDEKVTVNGIVPATPVLSQRIDVCSVDVDGDDFAIIEAMNIRPRLVIAEFNPTCPPHLEMRQRELGETFGASLRAIERLGVRKGYRFIGATYANAFLVIEDEAAPFDGYETDLAVLCPPEAYTYAVSDFGGRMVLAGQIPPWQSHGPYVPALECSAYVSAMTDDPAYLRTGFEQLWGPAEWFVAAGLDREMLRSVLAEGRPLVCLDLSGGTLTADEWVAVGAEFPAYRAVQAGPVLGLVRQ